MYTHSCKSRVGGVAGFGGKLLRATISDASQVMCLPSWLHARTFKCTATARRDRCCFQCAVQLSVHSGFAIGALLAMPSCGQARAFQR